MAIYGFDENKNLTEIETGGGNPLIVGNTTYHISSVNRTTFTFNNGTLITYTCSLTTSSNTVNLEQFISDIENNKTYLITVSGTGEATGLNKVPLSWGSVGTGFYTLSGTISFGYDLIFLNILMNQYGADFRYWCLTDIFSPYFISVTFYIYQE